MVAWCTKPGHGTRLIPAGALQGVQWMKTPDYVQAVGYIDQTFINILRGDWGGEMDPHGADLVSKPSSHYRTSSAFASPSPLDPSEDMLGFLILMNPDALIPLSR